MHFWINDGVKAGFLQGTLEQQQLDEHNRLFGWACYSLLMKARRRDAVKHSPVHTKRIEIILKLRCLRHQLPSSSIEIDQPLIATSSRLQDLIKRGGLFLPLSIFALFTTDVMKCIKRKVTMKLGKDSLHDVISLLKENKEVIALFNDIWDQVFAKKEDEYIRIDVSARDMLRLELIAKLVNVRSSEVVNRFKEK